MRDKIRFALSALMWAVVLLAAYAVAAHAQTSATIDQDRAPQKKSGVAPQASSNKPVTGSGTEGKSPRTSRQVALKFDASLQIQRTLLCRARRSVSQ